MPMRVIGGQIPKSRRSIARRDEPIAGQYHVYLLVSAAGEKLVEFPALISPPIILIQPDSQAVRGTGPAL
jgi:hypothetical protein